MNRRRSLVFYIYFICFILIGINANAQIELKPEEMKVSQLKGLAKHAEQLGDPYSALEYYKELYKRKPHKTNYGFKVAELYRKARDYRNAQNVYFEVYNTSPDGYPIALYYHALMRKMNGDYDSALVYFNQFKKIVRKVDDSKDLKKLLKTDIEGCENAKSIIENPLKLILSHLDTSINKAHIEFSPIAVNDSSLIYASYKSDKLEYYNINDTNYKPKYRKFYKADLIDGAWKGGQLWDVPFNKGEYDIGNGAFNPDGNRFYFTKLDINWKNEIVSRIYVSNRDSGYWSEPELLPEEINSPNYTATMPTVGTESKKGNEIVYFVSNMPGGKGGMDLWYAEYDKKSQSFKKIKNCGSKVNTPGDELTPYFNMDLRRLFFSSDGHPGLGGLDVFKSNGELSSWSEPKNMGYPLNSSADDLYYVAGANKEFSFLVSNRIGGISLQNETCCDDLYTMQWTEFMQINVIGNVYELVENENSEDTVRGKRVLFDQADVSLYLFDEESMESFFIKTFKITNKEKYDLPLEQGNTYKLIAERDGYFNSSKFISTMNINETTTLEQDFELKMIPRKAIVLENIYYEFDRYDLTKDAKTTIDTTLVTLLKENPKIIIELSSHTDSKGDDDYNKKLSQKRAESVVKYLTDKGIESERLIAKGYGESKPVASNTNSDGSDNPEGRARNRRTEFKVVGSSDTRSSLNQEKLEIIHKEGAPSPDLYKETNE